MEAIDVYNDMGAVHDFRMFKESLAGVLPEDILAMLDSGYQGVNEYLPNAKGERGLLRVELIASLYNHRVVFV